MEILLICLSKDDSKWDSLEKKFHYEFVHLDVRPLNIFKDKNGQALRTFHSWSQNNML
jgi:hypothetical protein